jgi:hypothetical protein
MVRMPEAGREIYLDIAVLGEGVTKLDDGLTKVRPGLMIPKAGVKNSEWLAVQAKEFVAAEALVLPNELQELFCNRRTIGPFGKSMGRPTASPPRGVITR